MDTNGLGAFKQYIWNLLLSTDQWVNVILLGSNDFFKAYFGQANHCMESIENPNAAYSELWSWIKDEE